MSVSEVCSPEIQYVDILKYCCCNLIRSFSYTKVNSVLLSIMERTVLPLWRQLCRNSVTFCWILSDHLHLNKYYPLLQTTGTWLDRTFPLQQVFDVTSNSGQQIYKNILTYFTFQAGSSGFCARAVSFKFKFSRVRQNQRIIVGKLAQLMSIAAYSNEAIAFSVKLLAAIVSFDFVARTICRFATATNRTAASDIYQFCLVMCLRIIQPCIIKPTNIVSSC